MFLDRLIGNLELPKCFDLPLRHPVADGVYPPQHMVDPERRDDLTGQMRTDQRMHRHKLAKRESQLHIDVEMPCCVCPIRQNSVVRGISPVLVKLWSIPAALLKPEW